MRSLFAVAFLLAAATFALASAETKKAKTQDYGTCYVGISTLTNETYSVAIPYVQIQLSYDNSTWQNFGTTDAYGHSSSSHSTYEDGSPATYYMRAVSSEYTFVTEYNQPTYVFTCYANSLWSATFFGTPN